MNQAIDATLVDARGARPESRASAVEDHYALAPGSRDADAAAAPQNL